MPTCQCSNITNAYYRGAMGIILVYDITDEPSFLNVRFWMNQIERHSTSDAKPRLALLGNKADLEEERVVTFERAQELANDYQIPFFECSAKTSANIEQAFDALIRGIVDEKSEAAVAQAKGVRLDKNAKLKHIKQRIDCSACTKF